MYTQHETLNMNVMKHLFTYV